MLIINIIVLNLLMLRKWLLIFDLDVVEVTRLVEVEMKMQMRLK